MKTIPQVEQRHSLKTRGVAMLTIVALVSLWVLLPVNSVYSAGIDDVTVTLSVATTSAADQVTVAFTFGTLVNGNTIKIYLGDTTGGSPFGLNSVTTADISCSDNGTGEAYTVNSVTAASASVPLWTQITATTVGSGATVVTCLIGDGTPNPTNPTVANGYSVAVVTTNDSGAGVAYVGNGNQVTVSATVLPNLTLTIDNADGTKCTTASGVTSCNVGVVTTGAVATGNYDLNVGTNAGSGATLKVKDDGNLRNGADDINDITENTTVAAGTEGNGIAVSSDAAWTEASPFDDDDTPTTTSFQDVASTAGPIAASGDDVTITHRIAVSSATKALTYTHIMTYEAVANF